MQRGDPAAIGKMRAVAGIQVGFSRESIGEKHVVAFEFDVVIDHVADRHLGDCCAIDQVLDRDQHRLEEHRMIG